MKRTILKFANSCLTPFDARIVHKSADLFQMSSAFRRTVRHKFEIRTVIDIGASNGKWSLEAMKEFKDASFFAIEPLRERSKALEDCKRNHQRFDYELCAAGESNGDVTLNVMGDLDGSTVDGEGGEQRVVPVKAVDAIVSSKNLKGPFLLKFDTHGYEIPILNGAVETISKTNVVIMEVYNYHITEHALLFYQMCSYMENLGFRCYDLVAPSLRLYDDTFWQMDIFFCKKEAPMFTYPHYS